MPALSRRRFVALSVLGSALAATGCGTGGAAETKTIRYQGWAGTVIPPELAQDLGYFGDVRLEWVGDTISGPQDIQSAATGQVDFGGAFNGAVVKLAARGAPIKSVISYYGVDRLQFNGFYTLADSPIRTARDLVGAKVGMNTLGAHDEAMLDIYLQRNGVPKDETGKVEPIVVPPVNTEQSLRQRQIEVAALGDILRDKALARGGIRELFNDYQLLGDFSAGTYVVNEKFLRQNPNTTRTFVTGVARAIEWTKTTPLPEVVDRFVRIVKRRNRNEDTDPLRYFKSWGVAGKGGLIADRELAVWVDWLTQRGDIRPGQVDVSRLYTNDFNGIERVAAAPAPSTR